MTSEPSARLRLGLGRTVGIFLVSVPAVALGLGAVVDFGPEGEARVGAFPAALAIFDPIVWESARNSLAVALASAALATIAGVGLGKASQVLAGRRGSGLLRASASASGTVPPFLLAIGLQGLIGLPGVAETDGGSLEWAVAVAAFVLWGTPRVAGAAARAFDEVGPALEDAARLAGAHGWRMAMRLKVRPEVARAASVVFASAWVDPAVPLAAGLRRTLPVQVVAAALGPGTLPKAATIALGLAAAVALLAWVVRLRGHSGSAGWSGEPVPSSGRSRGAGRGRWFASVGMIAWCLAASLPAVGLVRLAELGEGAGLVRSGSNESIRGAFPWGPIRDAAGIGAAAASVGLGLAWTLGLGRSPRAGTETLRGPSPWSIAGGPTLAAGIAALVIPGLLRWASGGWLGGWPSLVAGWIDPIRRPGVLLVMTIAATRAGGLGADVWRARRRVQPSMVDAARTSGATRARAWRTIVLPQVAPGVLGAWLGTAITSGLDVSAALVLLPTTAIWPIGPAVLEAIGTVNGLPVAARLALAGGLASLLGAIVRRGRA